MSTQLKFDGPRLDELLERVGRELGPDAVIVDAQRTRRGGVGGFFAREWFEVVVAGPEAGGSGATAADLAEAPDPLLAMADAVQDRVEGRETPAPGSLAAAPALVAGGEADTHEQAEDSAFARVLSRAGGIDPDGATAPGTSAAAAAPRPAQMPRPSAPTDRGPATAGARERPLRDLGLAEMLTELDRLVARAPLPVVDSPVIAIVGDLRISRPVASAVAARLGLGEADVMVATPESRDGIPAWLRIGDPDAARARSARWRRSEQPVVVAVDLTPGREGHLWTAELLAALDADQIRLVARAWQVTDELAPKAAVLGGVDGLELVELEAAAEPEAFLELDLPVVGIDGRPATSELWAALLMERRNDAIA